jgi:hypothetical protein
MPEKGVPCLHYSIARYLYTGITQYYWAGAMKPPSYNSALDMLGLSTGCYSTHAPAPAHMQLSLSEKIQLPLASLRVLELLHSSRCRR